MLNDLPLDGEEVPAFEEEQRAKVPPFENRLRDLCRASDSMSVGLTVAPDDHLGFMALLFLPNL